MPGQGRLGDKAKIQADAHGCPGCPHTGVGPAIMGSPNVFVNGLPALRVDDVGIHAICCGPNMWQAQSGSPTVFINGKAAYRKLDAARHCGGSGQLIEGSTDVILDEATGGGAVGGGAAGGGGNGDGGGDGSGNDGGGSEADGKDLGGSGAGGLGISGGNGNATSGLNVIGGGGGAGPAVGPVPLTFDVRMLFTLGDRSLVRWLPPVNAGFTRNASGQAVVDGAQIQLVAKSGTPTSPQTTSATGSASFGILPDGDYDATLVPPSGKDSPSEAGPDSVGTASTKAQPLFRVRQTVLSLTLTTTNGKQSISSLSVTAGSFTSNAYFTGNSILFDWKPDWIRAVNLHNTVNPITTVILHCTDGQNQDGQTSQPAGQPKIGNTINDFLGAQKTSAHYVVDVDGHALKMVNDRTDRASHAFPGAWEGVININAFTIGIEQVEGRANFPNSPLIAYPQVQRDATLKLVTALIQGFSLCRHRIVGHGDTDIISEANQQPGFNRSDPGPQFDWPFFEQNGAGTQASSSAALPSTVYGGLFATATFKAFIGNDSDTTGTYGGTPMSSIIQAQKPVTQIQQDLIDLGFPTNTGSGSRTPTGVIDGPTSSAIRKFKRRFQGLGRPSTTDDARIDPQTATLLHSAAEDRRNNQCP